jgi:Rhodopirellula transposase DDE domain
MGRRGLWTGLRLEQICTQLRGVGISVSPNTVRHLLDQLGYALHSNRKSLSGPQNPQRDRQFRYLQAQRQDFARNGLPIISVDTKKKEMVGPFKNAGRIWSREALPVNDHDFRSQAKGMAIPRGLYDLQANRGSVVIGTSHDTPQFAAEAIVEWWRSEGRRRYGQASELLILADSGGSNGARCRLWKWALQEKLVNRFQLAVTVCHYPTGASKWNPIEHRLFSEITKHWAGQPLTDYPTIVRLIGETKTQTGLRVHCALSTKYYATKIKVSDDQMRELDFLKHPTLPDWNYTLLPRVNRN